MKTLRRLKEKASIDYKTNASTKQNNEVNKNKIILRILPGLSMGSKSSPEGSDPSAGRRTNVNPLGLSERTSAPYALLGCTFSFLKERTGKWSVLEQM